MSIGKLMNKLTGSKKLLNFAVIAAFAAIALIFLTSLTGSSDNDYTKLSEDYSERIRSQLIGIVTSIDGVGEAEIFLTMENSGENIYLNNSDKKTKSVEPTVRGVVVVCEGGDDPVVVSRVLSAVTRSLSLSSDKVCITKLAK